MQSGLQSRAEPTTSARLGVAVPGALAVGSAGFTLDLWRRQGWSAGSVTDPGHVLLRKGIPALLLAGAAGAVASYVAAGHMTDQQAHAVGIGGLLGYGVLGGGMAAAVRIRDPRGVWSMIRNAHGELVPRYSDAVKFRELSGYAMSYGTVGGVAGAGLGALLSRSSSGDTHISNSQGPTQ